MSSLNGKFLSFTLAGLLVAALASAQTAPYVRTAIVSPTPGNDIASGTTLLTTLAGLTPAPSVTNKWLVKIEPGTYDVGTTPLQMRSWVDIEGSGILQTSIRGNVGPTLLSPNFDEVSNVKTATSLNQGVVRGANNAEIRQLTIDCVSSTEQPACMGMINDSVSPRITDIRIKAITAMTGGAHWGMRNYYSSPILDRVEIRAANATNGDNYGIVNVGGSFQSVPVIRNSEILANGAGVRNIGILNRGWAAANPISNTNVTSMGGTFAYALWHIESYNSPYHIDNSKLWGTLGSTDSVGLKQDAFDSFIHPIVKDSRILGDTSGIDISQYSQIEVFNSQVNGGTYSVVGGDLKIASTWIQSGTVNGVTAVCAGVWNNAFTFYATTCP